MKLCLDSQTVADTDRVDLLEIDPVTLPKVPS